MLIVPKLGVENKDVPEAVLPFLGDTVEIQLSSYEEGESNWRGIVERHGIGTLILHAPFGSHNIEDVVTSPTLYPLVERYLLRQLAYAEDVGMDIKMLFHASLPVESMQHLPIVEGIVRLLSALDQSPRLKLLLENTIVNLDTGGRRLQQDSLSYLLERLPPDQVQVCFDLCHYQASKNVVHDEYNFRPEWLGRIFSVHFSDTKNGEGFRHFPTTHGRVHDSLHGVARDLCVLRELGIDTQNMLIVSEISEADYMVRADEAKELRWLTRLAKEGLAF